MRAGIPVGHRIDDKRYVVSEIVGAAQWDKATLVSERVLFCAQRNPENEGAVESHLSKCAKGGAPGWSSEERGRVSVAVGGGKINSRSTQDQKQRTRVSAPHKADRPN